MEFQEERINIPWSFLSFIEGLNIDFDVKNS
jgi:hypothetical protein